MLARLPCVHKLLLLSLTQTLGTYEVCTQCISSDEMIPLSHSLSNALSLIFDAKVQQSGIHFNAHNPNINMPAVMSIDL